MIGQDREAPGNIGNWLNFMNKEILLFFHKLKILQQEKDHNYKLLKKLSENYLSIYIYILMFWYDDIQG